MSFTYDISTALGQVRFLVADTDASGYDFEDAEVEFAYSVASSVRGAAAMLFEVLACAEARLAVRTDRLGIVDDRKAVAGELRAQAARWRAEAEAEEGAGVLVRVVSPSWTSRDLRRNVGLDGETFTDYVQEKVEP